MGRDRPQGDPDILPEVARPDPLVPPELAAFLESGLTLVVGTTGADLKPNCAFGAGLRVDAGGRRITLFLGTESAAAAIEDLRARGAVAITASRPSDYRTLQLKGRALRVEAVAPGGRAALLACREAFVRQLEAVGWARSLVQRLAVWPCVSVEVELDAVYEQTPGPRAGSPLGRP
jgi:hypothetical protein